MDQGATEQENIVYIFSEFPLNYPGGVEALIKMMCGIFPRSGLLTKVIQNGKFLPSGYLNVQDDENKCNVETGKFFRPGFLKFLYQDFPELSSIPGASSSISVVFLRRVPTKKVLIELHKSKKKVIFCIHGIALERFRLTSPLIMAHQFIIRIMLRNLAKFISANIFVQVLTPHMRAQLIDAGANPSNVFLIENRFDVPNADMVRNDKSFNLIFIGRIENLQKGIKVLRKTIFQLYKLQPNIKIKIIGSGKDTQMLTRLPNNSEFLGHVNENDKKKLLQNANLALITSYLEPFPLVALEYLSLGIPIVTTPASGPAYILSKDRDFGSVSSFWPKEIARCIIRYYNSWENDKNSYFELRKRISEKSHQIFKPQEMFNDYVEMLEKVIKTS